MTPDQLEQLVGKRVDRAAYPVVITGNVAVMNANGSLLARCVPAAISEQDAENARPWLRSLRRRMTSNRGDYAGVPAKLRILEDGTLSNTTESAEVPSVVAGFLDRSGGRFPYCRPCALNAEEGWPTFIPVAQAVSQQMQRCVPDRWQRQMDEARRCHPAYIIPETCFSTVTINNTFSGALHRDRGDYADGFGCITVFRRGRFGGCLLGFPRYGVAFDLQDRDLLFFDPHEVHGNTPFENPQGEAQRDYERISVVYYLRSKMNQCGSPDEELERARRSTAVQGQE